MLSKKAVEALKDKLIAAGCSIPENYDYECRRSSKWAIDVKFFKALTYFAGARINARTGKITLL